MSVASVASVAAPRVSPSAHADTRIPALDGLRAIASLTVVFYHFFPHIARDWTSRFWALQSLPRHGDEGVNLFFVLSGFLISGILVSARDSPHYFSTFYVRRAWRILPLYYLVLAGYVIALLIAGPGSTALGRLLEPQLPLWTYVIYLQNLAMALASGYGATWMAGSWSLAVEEQFYLTLPSVVRVVSARTLGWVALAAVVVPIPIRAAVQHFKLVSELSNKVLLPMTVDSLAVGVLVMLAVRYRARWIAGRRAAVGWIAAAAVAAWLAYPLVLDPQQLVRFYFLDATATDLTCGAVLLYVLMAPDGWLGRWLSLGWMRALGNMAYSTYLFHPILLCFSFQLLRHGDPILRETSDLVPIAVAAVATVVVSYGSWALFESKLVKIGHRWRY
jgi:peptidoglycan/LPS O-acetylase OafA/YrhL